MAIDAASFPDDNLRAYVSDTLDTDKNGVLSGQELEVEPIDINEREISSLKGIEVFSRLDSLYCRYGITR